MAADLGVFFAPRGVAVVGASRDTSKLGHGVFRNLAQAAVSARWAAYPVNPSADTVLGHRCYPNIADVPDPVDLAAIILPAPHVPAVVDACGQRGLRGVIVLAGGFGEVGGEDDPTGRAREAELVEIVRRHNMRLLGPNCVGIIDNVSGLNTTFIAGRPPTGDIAFVSQSGAIGGAVVDWALAENVGFSRFISLGNQADVAEAEVVAYLGDDPHTHVITLYLETVADGRAFMDVARDVACRKPIIALKVGRTDAGARAAASHTGALTGTDVVYSAAFQQCGVLRVRTIDALFDAARTFTVYAGLQGDAVAVVSNAGGPAVLAADALSEAGLRLADLEAETQTRLRKVLPAGAQVGNPVDILGGADATVYGAVLEATLADPNVDGVIAVHVPQALVSPRDVAEAIAQAAVPFDKRLDKLAVAGGRRLSFRTGQRAGLPILASFMGGGTVAAARDRLRRYGIPDYPTPERAAQALGWLTRRRRWLARSDEGAPDFSDTHASVVRRWLEALQVGGGRRASAAGRATLTGRLAFDILGAYAIPTIETRVADTAREAVAAAEGIGYPVALKAVAPALLHKTEAGGVALNVADATTVEEAYERLMRDVPARSGITPDGVLVQPMAPEGWEVLCGFIRDPQFGPVVVYGLGGIYVEALGDVGFCVAPLTDADAREMIEATRSGRLLFGARGQAPADVDGIVACLQHLGLLALDHPEIAELDVNPLVVWSEGVLAVDVRISLAPDN